MAKRKIVLIEWWDTAHFIDEGSIEYYQEQSFTIFKAVGHLLRDDKTTVTIAMEISQYDQARDVSVIPKGCVKSIKVLK